jgi:hypothetical protein
MQQIKVRQLKGAVDAIVGQGIMLKRAKILKNLV